MFDKIIKKEKCHCKIFAEQLEENHRIKIDFLRKIILNEKSHMQLEKDNLLYDMKKNKLDKDAENNFLQGKIGALDWVLECCINEIH